MASWYPLRSAPPLSPHSAHLRTNAGMSLASRLAVIALVLFSEKVVLNFFVNFDGPLSTTRLGTLLNAAQLLGLRFCVSLLALLALFTYISGSERLIQVNSAAASVPIRVPWLALQLICVVALAPILWFLGGERGTILPFPLSVALLGLLGLLAALAMFMAMAPLALWIRALQAVGAPGLYALGTVLIATAVLYWSQQLWAPTAQVTFEIVSRLLRPIIPTLQGDPLTRVLSTEHFSVAITNICSGLEGVGLMLVFCCAWLVCFRAEYVFPRALILIPCGVLLIFALNAVRIAALVLIGNSGYPEVAGYGFHSQAGWIAFNVAACCIAVISRRIPWLNRNAAVRDATENRTATYLLPLLALLAAGMLARVLSSGFDFFDGLRLVAGGAMLFVCLRGLTMLGWGFSWRGPLAGIGVFAVWLTAAHVLLPQVSMPAALTAAPEWVRFCWIATRVATSVLVVPIAEELAYRGYLLRRIVAADFEAVALNKVGLWPLLLSSAVFGVAHGAMWIAGIVAGLIYAGVFIRTERMGEAVAAHATTNVLLAAYVLLLDHWELW
jgi:exosortase E/protease (VPEID-CTERM system)